MNPNSNKMRSTISWVLICVASFLMTASAFGQITVVNPGGPITINDNSAASPYPSLSGKVPALGAGVLEKVTVTLTGVSHGYPDDINILLEAPGAPGAQERTMLMSDAGGQFDLSNITFTLDSTAANALPDEAAILNNGVYRPVNNDGGELDFFPA